MDCSSDIEPLDDALAAMASLVPGIIAESALFGMFSLLVLFSTFILLRRGTGFLPNLSMLAATMVMYLSAASHWALDIYTLMKQIQDPRGFRPVYSWSVGTTVVVFLNFWFSDFIVIWRACILWQWDRRVVAISAALLFATLTFASLNVAFSRPPSNNPAFQVDIFGIVGLAMSLMANLWATSLIAVKAWQHRRSIKAHLNDGSRKTAVQSIMALLIESGILYCIVWAMFILSKIAKLGRFRHSLANAIPQLTGIYPTVIIVLVCLQKTHCDRRFTYNRATQSTMVVARRGTISIAHRTTEAQGASGLLFEVSPFNTVQLVLFNARNIPTSLLEALFWPSALCIRCTYIMERTERISFTCSSSGTSVSTTLEALIYEMDVLSRQHLVILGPV